MNRKIILLALGVTLAFVIGACASMKPIDPAVKGKIGDPVDPSSKHNVGNYGVNGYSGGILVPGDQTLSSPMGTDLTKTPVAKGKIGDPVDPSSKHNVGSYGVNGYSGGILVPGDQTPSGAIK
jgi:hypothetical protein